MTETPDTDRRPVSAARTWWARAALLCVVGAVAIPVVAAGLRGTLGLLIVGIGGVAVTVAALYWTLAHHGPRRWLAVCAVVIAPLAAAAMFIRANLLWVVLISLALALLALACARRAVTEPALATPAVEHPAAPAKRPFLIMNPHSGGGKVEKFDLRRRAEALGAEVFLLEGAETIDVEAVAREAVDRGADLLGVAGGDGTQALVAGVAAEHDLPFLVISAGTRNHFAMDLGLDRADPAASLSALTDGVELRVDLASINGRPFVNNASFGVYAEIVRDPAYRDDKTATVLRLLPDLLSEQTGATLTARIGDTEIPGPQAILVSNNPYGTGDLAGLSRRARLDLGVLGVVTVQVPNAAAAVGLLRSTRTRGLTQHAATTVTIEADTPTIPVGVDGESLELDTPVRCVITPGALRVRVPRERPDVRPAQPPLTWARIAELAGLRRGRATEASFD
ncbi:diacylglycerol/lipid kinase family protein [Nocardia takedensis]|uniref:diacylglycerol/lipid kinase family protein n=1 Tax=Nocardia takedensis TaxID=259390 RepID=UPI0002D765EA|nr:diacylglycerol kinase family protein [Nocardia takedensis]